MDILKSRASLQSFNQFK